jgi:hypothetical protein
MQNNVQGSSCNTKTMHYLSLWCEAGGVWMNELAGKYKTKTIQNDDSLSSLSPSPFSFFLNDSFSLLLSTI